MRASSSTTARPADRGAQAGQPGQVAADELAHLLVAANLARPRIVDHDLARPDGLQDPGVALAQRGQELSDRVGQAVLANLLARELRRAGELRKPRHLDPLLPGADGLTARCRRWPPGAFPRAAG